MDGVNTPTPRRPKDIGTAAETAVVRYLRANGWPNAERRALRGQLDAGDITGCLGVCIEVKGGKAARTASDNLIDAWLAETVKEKANANADVGVLVLQRGGFSSKRAGHWWAVMTDYQLECLHNADGKWRTGMRFPVRMLLSDAVKLIRAAGYGDPIEQVTG